MTIPTQASASGAKASLTRDRQAIEAFLPGLPDDWTGSDVGSVGDDGASRARIRPSSRQAKSILLADEFVGASYRRNVSRLIDDGRVVFAEAEIGDDAQAARRYVTRIVVADTSGQIYLFAVWTAGASRRFSIDGADVWRAGMSEPVGWSDSPAMLRSWLEDDHDDPDSEVQQCLTWFDDDGIDDQFAADEAVKDDEAVEDDGAELAIDQTTWTDDHLARGRRLIVDLDGAQWSLGDLAVEVFGPAPEQGAHDTQRPALERFAEDIGVPADRLAEYRMVATRWAPDDRLHGIGWTLHRDTRNRKRRARDLLSFLEQCKADEVAPTRARLRSYLKSLDGPTPRRGVTADVVRRHANTLLAELPQLSELDPGTLDALGALHQQLGKRLGQSQ